MMDWFSVHSHSSMKKKNKKQKKPQRDQSISRFSNGTSEQFHALLNENENTLNVLTENNILTKSSQNKKKKKRIFPFSFHYAEAACVVNALMWTNHQDTYCTLWWGMLVPSVGQIQNYIFFSVKKKRKSNLSKSQVHPTSGTSQLFHLLYSKNYVTTQHHTCVILFSGHVPPDSGR